MKEKILASASSLSLYPASVAAHAGHAEHSSTPDLLPLLGVTAGILIMAVGLFLSLKKYMKLSDSEEVED